MRSQKQVRRVGKVHSPKNAAAGKRKTYRKRLEARKAWQHNTILTGRQSPSNLLVPPPVYRKVKEPKQRSAEELAERQRLREQRRLEKELAKQRASTSALPKTKKENKAKKGARDGEQKKAGADQKAVVKVPKIKKPMIVEEAVKAKRLKTDQSQPTMKPAVVNVQQQKQKAPKKVDEPRKVKAQPKSEKEPQQHIKEPVQGEQNQAVRPEDGNKKIKSSVPTKNEQKTSAPSKKAENLEKLQMKEKSKGPLGGATQADEKTDAVVEVQKKRKKVSDASKTDKNGPEKKERTERNIEHPEDDKVQLLAAPFAVVESQQPAAPVAASPAEDSIMKNSDQNVVMGSSADSDDKLESGHKLAEERVLKQEWEVIQTDETEAKTADQSQLKADHGTAEDMNKKHKKKRNRRPDAEHRLSGNDFVEGDAHEMDEEEANADFTEIIGRRHKKKGHRDEHPKQAKHPSEGADEHDITVEGRPAAAGAGAGAAAAAAAREPQERGDMMPASDFGTDAEASEELPPPVHDDLMTPKSSTQQQQVLEDGNTVPESVNVMNTDAGHLIDLNDETQFTNADLSGAGDSKIPDKSLQGRELVNDESFGTHNEQKDEPDADWEHLVGGKSNRNNLEDQILEAHQELDESRAEGNPIEGPLETEGENFVDKEENILDDGIGGGNASGMPSEKTGHNGTTVKENSEEIAPKLFPDELDTEPSQPIGAIPNENAVRDAQPISNSGEGLTTEPSAEQEASSESAAVEYPPKDDAEIIGNEAGVEHYTLTESAGGDGVRQIEKFNAKDESGMNEVLAEHETPAESASADGAQRFPTEDVGIFGSETQNEHNTGDDSAAGNSIEHFEESFRKNDTEVFGAGMFVESESAVVIGVEHVSETVPKESSGMDATEHIVYGESVPNESMKHCEEPFSRNDVELFEGETAFEHCHTSEIASDVDGEHTEESTAEDLERRTRKVSTEQGESAPSVGDVKESLEKARSFTNGHSAFSKPTVDDMERIDVCLQKDGASGEIMQHTEEFSKDDARMFRSEARVEHAAAGDGTEYVGKLFPEEDAEMFGIETRVKCEAAGKSIPAETINYAEESFSKDVAGVFEIESFTGPAVPCDSAPGNGAEHVHDSFPKGDAEVPASEHISLTESTTGDAATQIEQPIQENDALDKFVIGETVQGDVQMFESELCAEYHAGKSFSVDNTVMMTDEHGTLHGFVCDEAVRLIEESFPKDGAPVFGSESPAELVLPWKSSTEEYAYKSFAKESAEMSTSADQDARDESVITEGIGEIASKKQTGFAKGTVAKEKVNELKDAAGILEESAGLDKATSEKGMGNVETELTGDLGCAAESAEKESVEMFGSEMLTRQEEITESPSEGPVCKGIDIEESRTQGHLDHDYENTLEKSEIEVVASETPMEQTGVGGLRSDAEYGMGSDPGQEPIHIEEPERIFETVEELGAMKNVEQQLNKENLKEQMRNSSGEQEAVLSETFGGKKSADEAHIGVETEDTEKLRQEKVMGRTLSLPVQSSAFANPLTDTSLQDGKNEQIKKQHEHDIGSEIDKGFDKAMASSDREQINSSGGGGFKIEKTMDQIKLASGEVPEDSETVSKSEISMETVSPQELQMNVAKLAEQHPELMEGAKLDLGGAVSGKMTVTTYTKEAKHEKVNVEKREPIVLAIERDKGKRIQSTRERVYKLLPRDVQFCVRMIEKYGDDYEAMANDDGNIFRDTAKGIARKIRIFKESPQYDAYLKQKAEQNVS